MSGELFPEVFEVPIEIVGHETKPMICNVGIQFVPINICPDVYGYSPVIVYFNDAITGKKFTCKQIASLINPDIMRRIVDGLQWWVSNDDEVDPESKELINLALGEIDDR